MVEGPVVGPVGRGQKRGACLRKTETAKGFGCGAGHRRCVIDDNVPERMKRRGVAVKAHDVARRLTDTGV